MLQGRKKSDQEYEDSKYFKLKKITRQKSDWSIENHVASKHIERDGDKRAKIIVSLKLMLERLRLYLWTKWNQIYKKLSFGEILHLTAKSLSLRLNITLNHSNLLG